MGAFGKVQDCGKKDPFSPQARWGDDGARQMLLSAPTHQRGISRLNVNLLAEKMAKLATWAIAVSGVERYLPEDESGYTLRVLLK